MVNWGMLSVFICVLIGVSVLALRAAHWRAGDMHRLQEWGLAGRRFGTISSWFLLGGDIYTAYSFIAVPGLIFASGSPGFFAIPYLIMAYPLAFIVLPRFWSVARHRGYITPADFVRDRFGRSLALAVAITGILATMPYIALQILGIEVALAQMGVPIEISLVIAFAVLAIYTYTSGLRAPALIAVVKDICIWLLVLVAIIYIPLKLGGMDKIFAAVQLKAQQHPTTFHTFLQPGDYSPYLSLALGSALALFLYPHTLTGVLSANSRKVIKRNAALLPAYTILLGMIALLGYVAIAAGIEPSSAYQTNSTLPALFAKMFPSWFAGFAFAALTIGALAPAAIMSIAASNLFTRNIYREYFHPNCTEREEAKMARTVSLLVKLGALAFILFFPTSLAINLQLLSNTWIIQTLPVFFLGLYTSWFHRRALLIGMLTGLGLGTWMILSQNFLSSIVTFSSGWFHLSIYAAIVALAINLCISIALTPVCRLLHISKGIDETTPADFEAHPVPGSQVEALEAQISQPAAEEKTLRESFRA
ncbi:MAG TPA: sodium:solute symporter family protein [Ktedonobacteraceae bacterium]